MSWIITEGGWIVSTESGDQLITEDGAGVALPTGVGAVAQFHNPTATATFTIAEEFPQVWGPVLRRLKATARPAGVAATAAVGQAIGRAPAEPKGVGALAGVGTARARGIINPTDAELLFILAAA